MPGPVTIYSDHPQGRREGPQRHLEGHKTTVWRTIHPGENPGFGYTARRHWGYRGTMSNRDCTVKISLSDAELALLDQRRGAVPRAVYLRGMLHGPEPRTRPRTAGRVSCGWQSAAGCATMSLRSFASAPPRRG